MLIRNQHADYLKPLEVIDTETLGVEAAETVERFLARRPNHRPTPLRSLPALARELGIGAIHLKDEGFRLGIFKALGGAYAVIRLVLEAAEQKLGRPVAIDELHSPEVAKISAGMTFGCATDGNHGRSVAQGAQLVGARSVIFVHGGISDARVAAIARYGAVMERVVGTYDDSVAEAARVCEANGWTVVSDTSWPGYERIPRLVMQGYTAIFREALEKLPEAPTHVFIQSGVGGIAAAASGYLASRYGAARPTFVVVDPARAACIFETARQGKPVKLAHGEPTVMAMLECCEPSQVAWRVLSRVADAFMTVEDDTAVEVMNLLARPFGHDPVVGESGGAGLAGLLTVARTPEMRATIGLDAHSRVLLVITEGATDPDRYRELVGLTPGGYCHRGEVTRGTGGTSLGEGRSRPSSRASEARPGIY